MHDFGRIFGYIVDNVLVPIVVNDFGRDLQRV